MRPLVLEPYSRPQVWGGSQLQTLYDKVAAAEERLGESWEISGHSLHVSRVLDGPLAGVSLNDLWLQHGDEWCPDPELRRLQQFPWLLKLLDCHEASSVQVHPTDAQAARLQPGESGKTEAWFVLAATPTSRLYTGLKPNVTDAELRRRLSEGTIAEVLHSVVPRPGEAYLIPAGLVHAIGAGLVLFEIEQCSDLTWRLFDWNRVDASGKPRLLHMEPALECIDWSLPAATAEQPVELPESVDGVRVERLLSCRWFAVDRVVLTAADWRFSASSLTAWFVLEGEGQLETADGLWTRGFHPGQTVLAPPDSQSQCWRRKSSETLQLLRCTWPEATR